MSFKPRPAAGAPPGTLILNSDSAPAQIRVTVVKDGKPIVHRCQRVDQIPPASAATSLVWIDVQGFGDGTVLMELARRFRISPLAMEDLVNTPQRPKFEIFEHQALIIAHSVPAENRSNAPSQLGIVFDRQYVLTFHQGCQHVMEPILQRLENPTARLRRMGADFLVYAILDACVDGCYPVLEHLGERIELLESDALKRPRPEILVEIHNVKNVLLQIRRSIWPQREMVLGLLHTETQFITSTTREYLRDTADHSQHLADLVDMYRESTSALVSTYMSAVAHRSNEIMKVLTLLTSVFVPPTFLAGVYGMNFANMPELQMAVAYPIALGLMLAMISGTLFYFYRRGWLVGVMISPNSEPANVAATASGKSEQLANTEHRQVVMDARHDPAMRGAPREVPRRATKRAA